MSYFGNFFPVLFGVTMPLGSDTALACNEWKEKTPVQNAISVV
jgi:hypothetical protein